MPLDGDPFGNDEQAIRKLLGHRLRDGRLRIRWSLEEVARRIGYTKKINKGMNRIARAEESGTGGKEFLDKLAGVLGLSILRIKREIKEQMRQRREKWLARWMARNQDSPVASHMVIRYFAGFYGPHALHSGVRSPPQAVAYARSFAQRHHHEVCLSITPMISVYFSTEGEVTFLADAARGHLNIPLMKME